MKSAIFESPLGTIAYRESRGPGPAVILLHGNSCSSRSFMRQLEGSLGEKRRLIAIDLPGHGDSQNATDAAAYTLPGYASALIALVRSLRLENAVFVGWSLGGHVVIEAAPDLPNASGFMIFGAPPLAFPPAMDKAFLPNPVFGLGFSADINKDQAQAFVGSFFKPGCTDTSPFFLDDVMRTDGNARSQLAASIAPSGYRDEVEVVSQLNRPLAILHGSDDQLVNCDYYRGLTMPTLWRGAVQMVHDAGHSPQWEQAPVFDALLDSFVVDTY